MVEQAKPLAIVTEASTGWKPSSPLWNRVWSTSSPPLVRAPSMLYSPMPGAARQGFLDQDFAARRVVDTNITCTIYLIQKICPRMRSRWTGRIPITGCIAGFYPGTDQAVYNATKASSTPSRSRSVRSSRTPASPSHA